MTDITIPREALDEGELAFFMEKDKTGKTRPALEAAFLAMIKAWPDSILMPVELILPLSKEPSNG